MVNMTVFKRPLFILAYFEWSRAPRAPALSSRGAHAPRLALSYSQPVGAAAPRLPHLTTWSKSVNPLDAGLSMPCALRPVYRCQAHRGRSIDAGLSMQLSWVPYPWRRDPTRCRPLGIDCRTAAVPPAADRRALRPSRQSAPVDEAWCRAGIGRARRFRQHLGDPWGRGDEETHVGTYQYTKFTSGRKFSIKAHG